MSSARAATRGTGREWNACGGPARPAVTCTAGTTRGCTAVGCEQFYPTAELAGGRCPDHGTVPDLVAEENWFFRLSRYAAPLRALIADRAIRVEPAGRRNEALAFIDGGLADFSVSRST